MSETLTLNNLVSGTAFAAVAASPFWVPALGKKRRRRKRSSSATTYADRVNADSKMMQLENEVQSSKVFWDICSKRPNVLGQYLIKEDNS